MFCFCSSTYQKNNAHFLKITINSDLVLRRARSTHRACKTSKIEFLHAISFVSLKKAEKTPILTYQDFVQSVLAWAPVSSEHIQSVHRVFKVHISVEEVTWSLQKLFLLKQNKQNTNPKIYPIWVRFSLICLTNDVGPCSIRVNQSTYS